MIFEKFCRERYVDKVEEQAKPLTKRKPKGFVKLLRENIVVLQLLSDIG